MDEMLRVWGENIRAARQALGLTTQAALATRIGVSSNTVHRWECGVMEPNREHKATLCRLLGDGLFPINGETQ